jgi:hypothetical protein
MMVGDSVAITYGHPACTVKNIRVDKMCLCIFLFARGCSRGGGGGPVADHLRLCDDGPTPGVGGGGMRKKDFNYVLKVLQQLLGE